MRSLFLYLFAAAIGSGVTYLFTTKEVAPPKGQLTFYGGDIFYIDLDKLHLGTESGRIDTTFTDMQGLSSYLEDMSVRFYEEGLTYEIGASMQLMDVTPKGKGMRVHTTNHYTDEDIELYLNAREEDTFFLLD